MQPKYKAVGTCIFCKDFVGPFRDGDLTDEHIVAYSLGGTDQLPQATCAAHQDLTRALDEHLARDWLRVYRHAHDFPSRTRSDRQLFYRVPVHNTRSGLDYVQEVPVSEVPGLYISPHLKLPGILAGAPREPVRMGHVLHVVDDKRLQSLMRRLPPGSRVRWTTGELKTEDFARMLAKVAHTFATAELGHGNFIPTLLDTIDGSFINPFHYVGGFEPSVHQEPSGLTLREEVIGETRHIVVSISLRSLPGIPRMQAVAGIPIEPCPFPRRSRQAQADEHLDMQRQRAALAKERGLYGRPGKSKKKHKSRAEKNN